MSANFFQAIWVAFGLCLANFLYQLMQTVPQIMVAADRSFFQVVAVAAAYLVMKGDVK